MSQTVTDIDAQTFTPRFILDEIRERIRKEMEPETYAHAERTAEVARRLAVAHGEDPDRAELAGLVHDIADRFSDRELLRLADHYAVPVSLTEARIPKLLHAKVGAEMLRESGIRDEELEVAMRDLDDAILQLYAWRMDELVAAGQPIHDQLTTSRNRLIERMLARGR